MLSGLNYFLVSLSALLVLTIVLRLEEHSYQKNFFLQSELCFGAEED